MWALAQVDLQQVQCLIVGRWAIQVAEELPAAHVIGMDISPIHPARVPPNCEFKIGNLIKDLDTFEEGSIDLVSSRHVQIIMVSDNDLVWLFWV